MRDDVVIAEGTEPNGLTYWAKNMLLGALFRNGQPDNQTTVPALYFGLISPLAVGDGTYTVDTSPTDTEASHPGWNEFTGYKVASRVAYPIIPYPLDGTNFLSLWPLQQANYLLRLHTNREQFLGIPQKPTILSSPAASSFTCGSGVFVKGTAPNLQYISLSDPSILFTGSVETDYYNAPVYSINEPGVLSGFFLSTENSWNPGVGNIFSTCLIQAGGCTLLTGDQLTIRWGINFCDISNPTGFWATD